MLCRDCICSVETTQCLCVEHTQSVGGGGGWGASRGYSGVTGFYPIHPPLPDIATPQLRGDLDLGEEVLP